MSRVLMKSDLLTENNKDILEKYVCPKCDGILRDAVQTSCGHWLCHGCAEEIFDKKETATPYCPRTDCGEELTTEEGRPFFPDRFVRKEINRFIVACINCKFGCGWEGMMGELGNHLGNCEHNKTECKHCNQAFSPLEYQSHVDQCPEMTVTCPLKDHGCETEEHPTPETSPGKYDFISSKVKKPTLKENHLLIANSALPSPVKSAHSYSESHDLIVSSCGDKNYLRRFVLAERPNEILHDEIPERRSMELCYAPCQVRGDDQDLQDKIGQLERNNTALIDKVNDVESRITTLERATFNATKVWKIKQLQQQINDAMAGNCTSIDSSPFYSNPLNSHGYKMCLRLYILGDGIGKGTHMSLFFVVMKGEFDNILQWPFTHKVTFKLINQCGARDIMDVFQPDPFSPSFQKPKSDMNVPYGCPRFVSIKELMQGGFIEDDAIFIKAEVDTASSIKNNTL
ncbi:PREDICTED: TNF receptor-associated factor 3-like isoform X1 [Amphimedon queenslandica]|uniref:Uncharacterized protein n=1 Tax=Amphimedon queenslandica TaxID=400682 RepID=A0AAN0J820_AMPQE|nr:PREDICTED: TNF receptor-associated factor 3-like isoform X1 [Amphimedon queenslandica]|eukprot:XP_019852876.1 PREDICTED: TNF receptor-associated factor 3-like isoform X1 [Amphimedon queenslandica]